MEKFIALLSEILELPAGGLEPTTPLHKIKAWDSLAMVHFLAMVDMQYNKDIMIDLLVAAETVTDLYALTIS
jgi:acyl carrier protein